MADVLPGSYLTTPLGNYPIFDSAYSQEYTPTFVWDRNQIVDMCLFFQPTSPIYDPYLFGLPSEAMAIVGYYGFTTGIGNIVRVSGGGWDTYNPRNDYSGQWLAVVPEPSFSSAAGLTLFLFAFCRRQSSHLQGRSL